MHKFLEIGVAFILSIVIVIEGPRFLKWWQDDNEFHEVANQLYVGTEKSCNLKLGEYEIVLGYRRIVDK